MSRLQPQWIPLAAVLCTIAACSQASTTSAATDGADAVAASVPSNAPLATQNAIVDARVFCAKLQPAIQPLVKPVLALHQANDSSTDSMHAGESGYVDCDFRQQNIQVDVSLHDDTDHTLFDNPNEGGYAPLSGFGDRARYSVKGAMGMRWVDVVRGSTGCEARMTLEDKQINGDWKQVAGKMCDAAFAMR